MKVKEKSLSLCVLECLCHTALIYPVLTVSWYLFADHDCINISVLGAVAVSEILLYCLRKRVHNSLLFICMVIVYMAAICILGYLIRYYIYFFIGAAMSAFCLIIGFCGRHRDLEKPGGGFAGLLIFTGICVWLTDSPELLLLFYICEAVYVLALIIYNNIERADKFIWENRRTSFLYVSQIKYANYLITIMLAVLILAASAVCSVIFTPVLNLTREPLLNMIKSFMSYDFDIEMPGLGGTAGGGEQELETMVQNDSGGSVLRIILYIAGAAAVLFFAILFIIFIIKIIKNLSMSSREGDIKEYILPSGMDDEIEAVEKSGRESVNDKPSKMIRKIYKKKIKSSLKKGSTVGKSSTPDEQMDMAGLKGEAADKFADLYRKARYGNEECSESDVEEMKALR